MSHFHTCGLGLEQNPPVRQLRARSRILGDHIEEIVHGVAHVHWGNVPRAITRCPYASELDPKVNPRSRPRRSTDALTFSSIFGSGPPPPSPLPKTSREMSEDSRFYVPLVISSNPSQKSVLLPYFVIGESLVDISDRSLGGIRVFASQIRNGPGSVALFDRDVPTGVMWHRTCVPSMPTQLKVE